MNRLFMLAFLCLPVLHCFGQDEKIHIPTGDAYAGYVKQLEEGKTDIDYVAFRDSFLKSKSYSPFSVEGLTLKKELYRAVEEKNYTKVISTAKKMLGIDYTNMYAHKYLQQTYKILGDEANYKKYHDIEFGLLKSIVNSGTGNTCESGWHVIKVEEEYFILEMVGASLIEQEVVSGGENSCDKMEVKTEDGKTKTYYFEINGVLEAEANALKD